MSNEQTQSGFLSQLKKIVNITYRVNVNPLYQVSDSRYTESQVTIQSQSLCLRHKEDDDDDDSIVPSILSGLETRSLGLNTLGTM